MKKIWLLVVVAAVLFVPALQPVAVCSAECSEPAALPTTETTGLFCSIVFSLLDSVLASILPSVLPSVIGMVPGLMGRLPALTAPMGTIIGVLNVFLKLAYKTGIISLFSFLWGWTISCLSLPCRPFLALGSRIPSIGPYFSAIIVFLDSLSRLMRVEF